MLTALTCRAHDGCGIRSVASRVADKACAAARAHLGALGARWLYGMWYAICADGCIDTKTSTIRTDIHVAIALGRAVGGEGHAEGGPVRGAAQVERLVLSRPRVAHDAACHVHCRDCNGAG